jgi:hypothetical protein
MTKDPTTTNASDEEGLPKSDQASRSADQNQSDPSESQVRQFQSRSSTQHTTPGRKPLFRS